MQKKIAIITFLIISCFTNVFSETTVFSARGIGDMNRNYFTASAGTVDSTTIYYNNYAQWADVSNLTFLLGFNYNNHEILSDNGNTAFDGMEIEGFSFALPFGDRKDKSVIGISLSPYSQADVYNNYSQVSSDSLYETMITTEKTEKRSGSINNFSLIYAKKINEFNFSFNYTTLFGKIDETIMNHYKTNEWDVVYTDIYKTSILHHCFGMGLRYSILDNYSVGGSVLVPFSTSAERSVKHNTSAEESSDISDAEWPVSFTVGMSAKIGDFNLNGDYSYAGFENKNVVLDDKNIFTNSQNIAFEVSYKFQKRNIKNYFKKIKYKAGFSYGIRAYKYKDSDINDLDIYGGFDLPINKKGSMVSTIFQYSITGDKSVLGIEDNAFKVGIIFTGIGNWWLRKNKYDD